MLMKRRMSWNNKKKFSGWNGWFDDLGPWCGSISRIDRGMKPWTEVGESGAPQRFPERIRSHMWVEKNAPWMGTHLRRKLVMIFGSGIEQEISKL